jgi:hypothetical protein
MRIILISFFLSFAVLIFGQSESEKVVEAIIEIDKDLSESTIIVCEKFMDYSDSARIQSVSAEFGELMSEDIKYIQFGNIKARLLSKSGLIKLGKIAEKLNEVSNSKEDNFPLTSYQLVNDIFDLDLCTFSKPLFTKDKRISLVQYSVITGNPLGLGDFSSTYLMEKNDGKWTLKDILQFEE